MRVSSAACPFAGCQPPFIAGQPIARPGHNCVRQMVAGLPLVCCWVIKAKLGFFRRALIPINMRNVTSGSRVHDFQHWINKSNLWQIAIDDFDVTDPITPHVIHRDDVRTVQGGHDTRPRAPPSTPFHKAQARIARRNAGSLLGEREPGHGGGRPKNVCARVGVALAGRAAVAIRTRPDPGTWRLRPVAIL